MNRTLGWINLTGVLLLAGLCVAQWNHNRRLNREVIDLTKVRLAQAESLTERDQALTRTQADLERFREQLMVSSTLASDAREKVAKLELEVPRLTVERDRLQESVTQWSAAVTVRDSRLAEAQEQILKLAQERNEVVERYNELAARNQTPTAQ